MYGQRDYAPPISDWKRGKTAFIAGKPTWTWRSVHGQGSRGPGRYVITEEAPGEYTLQAFARSGTSAFLGYLDEAGRPFPRPVTLDSLDDAVAAANAHHVATAHQLNHPDTAWMASTPDAPQHRGAANRRGQRRWDPNVQRCRADTVRYKRNPDGSTTKLSRGRFVNCERQMLAAARPRVNGRFVAGPPAEELDVVVSPTWLPPEERAAATQRMPLSFFRRATPEETAAATPAPAPPAPQPESSLPWWAQGPARPPQRSSAFDLLDVPEPQGLDAPSSPVRVRTVKRPQPAQQYRLPFFGPSPVQPEPTRGQRDVSQPKKNIVRWRRTRGHGGLEFLTFNSPVLGPMVLTRVMGTYTLSLTRRPTPEWALPLLRPLFDKHWVNSRKAVRDVMAVYLQLSRMPEYHQ